MAILFFLLLLGAGLGYCLVGGGISFAGAYRSWLSRGDTQGVRVQLVFLAAGITLHAVYFGFAGSSGGFVAPTGVAVATGAFVFGIGMQFARGCGSGALAALGAGSLRMRLVLPAFIAGSFWGSLDAGFWDRLPAFPAVSLGEIWGWPMAASLQIAVIGLIWILLPGDTRLTGRQVGTAFILAVLAVLCLPLAGHPWGITWGFALVGAKAAAALGWMPGPGTTWSQGWMAQALLDPVWTDSTVLMDVGLVSGAFAAAQSQSTKSAFVRPDRAGWILAATGGLAMGYGARISSGCNIGAFVGGIVSGSPHGWLWIMAALAGSRLGIALGERWQEPAARISGSPIGSPGT